MKNKVYFINIQRDLIDQSIASNYYEFFFTQSRIIEDYILCSAHGIFLFDPEKSVQFNEHSFFKDILHIDRDILRGLMQAEVFLSFLDQHIGRKRLVNPRQFEIIVGSVVKSKVEPMLGKGLVKEIKDNQVLVNFPMAPKNISKNEIVCHRSILRTLTHIKEIELERK